MEIRYSCHSGNLSGTSPYSLKDGDKEKAGVLREREDSLEKKVGDPEVFQVRDVCERVNQREERSHCCWRD